MDNRRLWQRQRDAQAAAEQPARAEQGVPPPLTREQIARDLARYGHDPSVLLSEWDAYTQRIGYRAAQDRLQLGAAIYRLARPGETPDLWVSDAHEGGDCQGYVRL
jgi:hypothetical protein